MAGVNQEMTHDEIWDDSALINSWDEALAEYRKYHSIHRNGGNVDAIQNPQLEQTASAKQSHNGMVEPSDNEEIEDTPGMRENDENLTRETTNTTEESRPRMPAPPAPAGLLGSVRDEGLKRLLMSWYYAGYYTGLYEGQNSSPQNREASEK